MSFEFFDPTASPTAQTRDKIDYAPRPQKLAGVRVGLIDNGKINAQPILRKIAQYLEEQHGTQLVQVSVKKSPGHGVDEGALADLKSKVDVVIAGVGD